MSYLRGTDVIVGDVTIPKADAVYTDSSTVTAVQRALKDKGFDPGPVDGVYGPKTKKAIQAMQAALGNEQTGVIDYGVLIALRVSAPKQSSSPSLPRASSDASTAGAFTQLVKTSTAGPLTTPTAGFWGQPLFEGAPVKRWQGAIGSLGIFAMVFGLYKAVAR